MKDVNQVRFLPLLFCWNAPSLLYCSRQNQQNGNPVSTAEISPELSFQCSRALLALSQTEEWNKNVHSFSLHAQSKELRKFRLRPFIFWDLVPHTCTFGCFVSDCKMSKLFTFESSGRGTFGISTNFDCKGICRTRETMRFGGTCRWRWIARPTASLHSHQVPWSNHLLKHWTLMER